VDFPTWSRTINNIKKESILDHVYSNDITTLDKCHFFTPNFGDHLVVVADVQTTLNPVKERVVRNWHNYQPEKLISTLSNMNLDFENDSVQEYWNSLENVLINVCDNLAPLSTFQKTPFSKKFIPANIKSSLNKRKRLLKLNNTRKCPEIAKSIKILNKEIKFHFYKNKTDLIQSKIKSSGNIWKAVKIAKNQSTNDIPQNLTLGNVEINCDSTADAFADFFHEKIEKIKKDVIVNELVYNGKNKLLVLDRFFMGEAEVRSCLDTLKPKTCEGYDRIPVRILYDARHLLAFPLSILFRKIYEQRSIPDQWKIAKILPLHKKGNKNQIENYRPIANLCCASKIFEKLILKQIHYLENTNNLDLTGKQQHGFKKSKSTATAGLLLQSIIARAADDDNFTIMASLDLSAAFDLVNVELLIKRLRIIGLPGDLINLIEIWLSDRKFYVEVDGSCSAVHGSGTGTIQGSVLGPVLHAIFVSPLFELTKITNFADDNFVVLWNKILSKLILNIEKELEMIIKWLKDSGLMVNSSKTEICLFHRNDQPDVLVMISGAPVKSKKSMNVLGVIFDCKLNWNEQVANAIKNQIKPFTRFK
jgi:hypothetical protein